MRPERAAERRAMESPVILSPPPAVTPPLKNGISCVIINCVEWRNSLSVLDIGPEYDHHGHDAAHQAQDVRQLVPGQG